MAVMHHLQLVFVPIAWVAMFVLGFFNMRRMRLQNRQAMAYMSPGVRMYVRVMWLLVGVGFATAVVVLAGVLIVASH